MFDRALNKSQNQPLQMFFKTRVLKNLENFTGKHQCWNLFLIKLQARSATLLKRNSNTVVFQRILRNFYEKLFCRTSAVAAFNASDLLSSH